MFRELKKIKQIWNALKIGATSGEVFSEEMVEGLPPIVQKYFLHTIKPGTPIPQSMECSMSGQIRMDERRIWIPFEAKERIADGKGFMWKSNIRLSPFFPIKGVDYYYRQEGGIRFAVFGIKPIAQESGPGVSRSAAGRTLIESVWLPTFFLPRNGATWKSIDENRAEVEVSIDDIDSTITMHFDENGSIKEAVMPRWRKDPNGETSLLPFGFSADNEKEFNGITIPVSGKAGWNYGTEAFHEFFRFEINSVSFF